MKNIAIIFLGLTTLVLIAVTTMSTLTVAFPWIFYLTCLGQLLLLIAVYLLLRDNYTTEKTFDDWYEDHPIGREE
ncbi:MAG: hypothetical protein WBV11_00100 [Salegentibacter sp.]